MLPQNEFWGMPFSGNMTDYSPYMRLYNASAHAVKDVHSSLKVGGPSSNGKVCCIETFIDVANNMSAPFDFVSGHICKSDPAPHLLCGLPC